MVKTDEEALICDLAETYQIYDYRQLPATRVAVFARGLRDNSRIKMKLSGIEVDPQAMLLASIADGVNLLVWQKTKDAMRGLNRPASILNSTFAKKQNAEVVYESSKDFEIARQSLIKKINKQKEADGNGN